jgi:hypothetical protein
LKVGRSLAFDGGRGQASDGELDGVARRATASMNFDATDVMDGWTRGCSVATAWAGTEPREKRRRGKVGNSYQASVNWSTMTTAVENESLRTWRETPKSVFKRLPRPQSPKAFLKRMSRQQQMAAAQQAPAAVPER